MFARPKRRGAGIPRPERDPGGQQGLPIFVDLIAQPIGLRLHARADADTVILQRHRPPPQSFDRISRRADIAAASILDLMHDRALGDRQRVQIASLVGGVQPRPARRHRRRTPARDAHR